MMREDASNRKRSWWLFATLGSFLALVAMLAFFVLRPPHGYLTSGDLSFIMIHPDGTIYEEYNFDSTLDPIVAQAKLEHPGTWKDGGYGGIPGQSFRWRTHEFRDSGVSVTFTGRMPGGRMDSGHVPDGKTGIVRVIRKANTIDRIRAWYFQRKWRGARP
jgi:hypothetical protein